MAAASDVAALTKRMDIMEEAMSGLRMSVSELQQGVQRAVGAMMPKVDALLSAQGVGSQSALPSTGGDASGAAQQPVSAAPVASVVAPGASSAAPLLKAAENGDWQALGTLLETGTSIHQRDEHGNTALHLAAFSGQVEAVKVLLDAGASTETPGRRMRTPLHYAAALGRLEVAERLLKAGAKVDAGDAYGLTPLYLAAQEGHKKLVAFLHVKGASVDACDKKGDTLVFHAAKAAQWVAVTLLLARGVNAKKHKNSGQSLLVLAAKAGEGGVVRDLLRRGAASKKEQVAEALAVAGSAAVVWALAEVASDALQGKVGGRALIRAARDGRLEAMKALLDTGVVVRSAGYSFSYNDGIIYNGGTALHWASLEGRTLCVNELLRRGAKVAAKGNDGSTPLHFASKGGHVDAVRALLAAGANAAEQDCQRKTARDVAKTDAVRQILDSVRSETN